MSFFDIQNIAFRLLEYDMSNIELVAIYKFLQTLPPTKNEVPIGVQDGDPME